MKIKVGADPEIFILNRRGHVVSGHGIIPGTKAEPYKVKSGAVQLDGMAAEFNIDPAETVEEFEANILTVMGELKQFLPSGYDFARKSSHTFSDKFMNAQPEHTKVLGCDPDFDAYSGKINPSPSLLWVSPGFRTVSGHVHVGWEGAEDEDAANNFDNARTVARQLDCFLGAPSILADPKGGIRRNLYGKAGAFRPKKYGMEYRVLSNFWIFHREHIRWVFNNTFSAFYRMIEDGDDLTRSVGNTFRDFIKGRFSQRSSIIYYSELRNISLPSENL